MKDFFQLMNNAIFEKTMENVKNLDRQKKKKKKKKKQIKPAYLGLSTLEESKILMYEFWYDYVKPKYGTDAKLCYTDTDRFIVHVKTGDIYKDIAEDVETKFDTSNLEIEIQLTKGKNLKSNRINER